MSLLQELLASNQEFVKEKKYEGLLTDKFPDKKMAVVACMDARLVELLPQAMGLKNGDATIIKNAGALISKETFKNGV